MAHCLHEIEDEEITAGAKCLVASRKKAIKKKILKKFNLIPTIQVSSFLQQNLNHKELNNSLSFMNNNFKKYSNMVNKSYKIALKSIDNKTDHYKKFISQKHNSSINLSVQIPFLTNKAFNKYKYKYKKYFENRKLLVNNNHSTYNTIMNLRRGHTYKFKNPLQKDSIYRYDHLPVSPNSAENIISNRAIRYQKNLKKGMIQSKLSKHNYNFLEQSPEMTLKKRTFDTFNSTYLKRMKRSPYRLLASHVMKSDTVYINVSYHIIIIKKHLFKIYVSHLSKNTMFFLQITD